MEKSSMEMDFEEWELLPDNNHSLLDFGLESGKGIFAKELHFGPEGIVDMNYFICPTQPSKLLPESEAKEEPISVQKRPEGFKYIGVVPPPPVIIPDREVVSHVFFKKLKEDEFVVDMRMESPKKGIVMPQIEPRPILFSDDEEEEEEEEEFKGSEFKKEELENEKDEIEEKPCWEGFGVTIWRWRITGIGALCSIGVAAATICIFILGDQQRQKQQQHQSQRLQFQIYTDDKRIKQVMQQATRWNHAVSAVRGVPMTRAAHISFGGFYDGL